jgi:hypothetical protein
LPRIPTSRESSTPQITAEYTTPPMRDESGRRWTSPGRTALSGMAWRRWPVCRAEPSVHVLAAGRCSRHAPRSLRTDPRTSRRSSRRGPAPPAAAESVLKDDRIGDQGKDADALRAAARAARDGLRPAAGAARGAGGRLGLQSADDTPPRFHAAATYRLLASRGRKARGAPEASGRFVLREGARQEPHLRVPITVSSRDSGVPRRAHGAHRRLPITLRA